MKIGNCSRSPDNADFTAGPAPDQTIDPTGDEGDDGEKTGRKRQIEVRGATPYY